MIPLRQRQRFSAEEGSGSRASLDIPIPSGKGVQAKATPIGNGKKGVIGLIAQSVPRD